MHSILSVTSLPNIGVQLRRNIRGKRLNPVSSMILIASCRYACPGKCPPGIGLDSRYFFFNILITLKYAVPVGELNE